MIIAIKTYPSALSAPRPYRLAGLFALCLMVMVWLGVPQKSYAACICDGCTCTLDQFIQNMQLNAELHNETRYDEFGLVVPIPFYAYNTNPGFIQGQPQGTQRIGEHQVFVWELWYNNFLPVWMDMAEQLTVNAAWHTFAIGALIDAKHQLETQALFQERTAEIHKRYHPSVGMCTIGTNIRSLAASERRSRLTSHALSQRMLDRQLGTTGGLGINGPSSDQQGRVRFFLAYVCDRFDNNRIYNNPQTGFANICATTPRDDGTINLDVDFTRLVMNPRTINADFINPGNPQNEWGDHIFNLGANLYGHKVPSMVTIASASQTALQSQMVDMRSIIARRSVAQTSYSALVGLKARGTPGSGNNNTLQYMTILLQELGMTPEEVTAFVGENPSYYAQLEVLAKKLYQNPGFYRELYDKPENVRRKSAAMTAISSMLDREMFDSQLRAEAMLSQLLELRVQKAQDAVEDTFSRKGLKQ